MAFEINGILHYKPIYGIDKLNKIKNIDTLKISLCVEKNIELHVIDYSKEKYMKEKDKIKYFSIISDKIESKLKSNCQHL